MAAPALLAFDLDGTLVPTMEDYADKAADLMVEAFSTPFAEARAAYFRTSGLPYEQQLAQLYPDRVDTPDVAARFEDWKDGYLDQVSLDPAVQGLLAGWRSAGLKVAISSNNLEIYVSRLARDWPVDLALGYRPDDGFGKGEAHFAMLEQVTGLDRARFLFVGDSPNDCRIAARCGVRFTGLLTAAFVPQDFRAVDAAVDLIENLAEVSDRLA